MAALVTAGGCGLLSSTIAMKNIFRWLLSLVQTADRQFRDAVHSRGGQQRMTLEDQVQALEQLGLKLNEGVTIDDLLDLYEREEYERKPFDAILFALGFEVEREPWGRRISDSAWNFDLECIEETGAYVRIVQNFCRVAGLPDVISDLEDFVDVEGEKAWLKYKIDGEQRYYDIAVDNDWADPQTVSAVMEDIERDGKRFYALDNGQASIWFYLDQARADKINALTGNRWIKRLNC